MALDPDGNAVVELRAGRGKFANLRGRLVKVPFSSLETYTPKARLDASPRRPLSPATRSQLPPLPDDPDGQYDELYRIAEQADESGDTELRDAAMEARHEINNDSLTPEQESQIRAKLPAAEPETEPDQRGVAAQRPRAPKQAQKGSSLRSALRSWQEKRLRAKEMRYFDGTPAQRGDRLHFPLSDKERKAWDATPVEKKYEGYNEFGGRIVRAHPKSHSGTVLGVADTTAYVLMDDDSTRELAVADIARISDHYANRQYDRKGATRDDFLAREREADPEFYAKATLADREQRDKDAAEAEQIAREKYGWGTAASRPEPLMTESSQQRTFHQLSESGVDVWASAQREEIEAQRERAAARREMLREIHRESVFAEDIDGLLAEMEQLDNDALNASLEAVEAMAAATSNDDPDALRSATQTMITSAVARQNRDAALQEIESLSPLSARAQAEYAQLSPKGLARLATLIDEDRAHALALFERMADDDPLQAMAQAEVEHMLDRPSASPYDYTVLSNILPPARMTSRPSSALPASPSLYDPFAEPIRGKAELHLRDDENDGVVWASDDTLSAPLQSSDLPEGWNYLNSDGAHNFYVHDDGHLLEEVVGTDGKREYFPINPRTGSRIAERKNWGREVGYDSPASALADADRKRWMPTQRSPLPPSELPDGWTLLHEGLPYTVKRDGTKKYHMQNRHVYTDADGNRIVEVVSKDGYNRRYFPLDGQGNQMYDRLVFGNPVGQPSFSEAVDLANRKRKDQTPAPAPAPAPSDLKPSPEPAPDDLPWPLPDQPRPQPSPQGPVSPPDNEGGSRDNTDERQKRTDRRRAKSRVPITQRSMWKILWNGLAADVKDAVLTAISFFRSEDYQGPITENREAFNRWFDDNFTPSPAREMRGSHVSPEYWEDPELESESEPNEDFDPLLDQALARYAAINDQRGVARSFQPVNPLSDGWTELDVNEWRRRDWDQELRTAALYSDDPEWDHYEKSKLREFMLVRGRGPRRVFAKGGIEIADWSGATDEEISTLMARAEALAEKHPHPSGRMFINVGDDHFKGSNRDAHGIAIVNRPIININLRSIRASRRKYQSDADRVIDAMNSDGKVAPWYYADYYRMRIDPLEGVLAHEWGHTYPVADDRYFLLDQQIDFATIRDVAFQVARVNNPDLTDTDLARMAGMYANSEPVEFFAEMFAAQHFDSQMPIALAFRSVLDSLEPGKGRIVPRKSSHSMMIDLAPHDLVGLSDNQVIQVYQGFVDASASTRPEIAETFSQIIDLMKADGYTQLGDYEAADKHPDFEKRRELANRIQDQVLAETLNTGEMRALRTAMLSVLNLRAYDQLVKTQWLMATLRQGSHGVGGGEGVHAPDRKMAPDEVLAERFRRYSVAAVGPLFSEFDISRFVSTDENKEKYPGFNDAFLHGAYDFAITHGNSHSSSFKKKVIRALMLHSADPQEFSGKLVDTKKMQFRDADPRWLYLSIAALQNALANTRYDMAFRARIDEALASPDLWRGDYPTIAKKLEKRVAEIVVDTGIDLDEEFLDTSENDRKAYSRPIKYSIQRAFDEYLARIQHHEPGDRQTMSYEFESLVAQARAAKPGPTQYAAPPHPMLDMFSDPEDRATADHFLQYVRTAADLQFAWRRLFNSEMRAMLKDAVFYAKSNPEGSWPEYIDNIGGPDALERYVKAVMAGNSEKLTPEPDLEAGDPPSPPTATFDNPHGTPSNIPEQIRNLGVEIFRGMTKVVRRGAGNYHLGERYKLDKNGIPMRKGDVIHFPAGGDAGRKGLIKRGEGDGYIVNIITKRGKPDENGVRRPVVDAQGNPVVTGIVVRHYDPSYVGLPHLTDKRLRDKGILWDKPYADFRITGDAINELERINDNDNRARDVVMNFGIHARRMAGHGAGRIAPIVGKLFRLGRMAEAEPIQNRIVADRNGKLISEGDHVIHNGQKYIVVRPNYAWDNNWSPRVVLEPVGGGKTIQPVATSVEYVSDPTDFAFFRGAGGIDAPRPQDLQNVLEGLGLLTPELSRELDRNPESYDPLAVVKLLRNEDVQNFLDAEAENRAAIRYRFAIDNSGLPAPADHIPVTEGEWNIAQRDKANAVMLHAALAGHFADRNGVPKDISKDKVQDVFEAYEGGEKDVALRAEYIGLRSRFEDLDFTKISAEDRTAVAIAMRQVSEEQISTEIGRKRLRTALISMSILLEKNRDNLDAQKLDDFLSSAISVSHALQDWEAEFKARNQLTPAPAPPAPKPEPEPEPEPKPEPPAPRRQQESRGPTDAMNNVFARFDDRVKELRDAKEHDAAFDLQDVADEVADLIDSAKELNENYDILNRDLVLKNIEDHISDLRNSGESALADALADELQGLRSRYFGNDWQNAVDAANAAHSAGDPEERSIKVGDAQTAIDGLRSAGLVDKADDLQRQLDELDSEFRADDERAQPMELDAGMDRLNEIADALAADLRTQGAEGRKKSRIIRSEIRGLRDILGRIDDAEDENQIDQSVRDAEDIIDAASEIFPQDVMDEIRNIFNGNAQRVRSARSQPATTGSKYDDDAVRKQQIADLAELTANRSIIDIAKGLALGDISVLPDGWKIDDYWRASSANGYTMKRVISPSGQMYYTKQDRGGAEIEADYAKMLHEMGLRAPVVEYDGNSDGWFLIGHVGGEGVTVKGDFSDAFSRNPSDDSISGRGWTIRKVGLSDLDLADEDDVIRILMMNAIAGNVDRHHKNAFYGTDSNGKGVIIPIDHGFLFDNGHSYGVPPLGAVLGEGSSSGWTPDRNEGEMSGSNPNQFLRAFVERMRKQPDTGSAVYDQVLDQFERILESGNYSDRHKAYIRDRIKWMRSNKKMFIDITRKAVS